jgi:predicted ATP-grasp superfamily ATP-dependent carboligase
MAYGKAIVYAERALVIGSQLAPFATQRAAEYWPAIADIPRAGTEIPTGHPVTTVFTSDETEDAVLVALKNRVADVSAALAK